MPRYIRRSYFDGELGPGALIDSLVFHAPDDAKAIKRATKIHDWRGATRAVLLDDKEHIICRLKVRSSLLLS